MTTRQNPTHGIAPADARPRPAWPIGRKVLAYFLLTLLAGISIWFIDRGAMHVMFSQPTQ